MNECITLRGDWVHLKAHTFTDLAHQKTTTSCGALSEQNFSKEHFTTHCFDIVYFTKIL